MCNSKFLKHDRSIDRPMYEACDRIGFQFGLDLPHIYVCTIYISPSIPQSSLPSIFGLIRRRCGQINRRLFQLSFIHHITEHRAREPCGIHEILFAIVFILFLLFFVIVLFRICLFIQSFYAQIIIVLSCKFCYRNAKIINWIYTCCSCCYCCSFWHSGKFLGWVSEQLSSSLLITSLRRRANSLVQSYSICFFFFAFLTLKSKDPHKQPSNLLVSAC